MIYEIEALGFTGFYQGIWEQSENEWTEILNEEINYLQFHEEWGFGPNYRDDIAQLYSENFVELMNEILGTDMKLVSQQVSSPREYNFTTDRIFCTVEIGDYDEFVQKLIALANLPENRADVAETIRCNHSSCSGFISFMSNDMDEWCNKYLLDPNSEYLNYFVGYLANAIEPGCLQDLNNGVFEHACCNGYQNIQPESDEAKEEWELCQGNPDLYQKFIEEYRKNHIDPQRSDWPVDNIRRYELDWDEFKEAFSEYIENYEKEQQRKAWLAAQPTIPGLI